MKHTFVICAYKKSPYLEQCLESIKKQTIESEIILSTATPNPYLEEMCQKYNVVYMVRSGKPEISADWNYGLSLAKTTYATIAHQDDIYEPHYVENVLSFAKKQKAETGMEVSIIFTDYYEILGVQKQTRGINLFIKKFLLLPLRKTSRQSKVFYKRLVIRFGNAISCPTVTYNMPHIRALLQKEGRPHLFATHFRSNLDWEAWEWLSKLPCSFVYVPNMLMGHRIHEGSETSAVIQDKQRTIEDYEMFCKFWPRWVAGLISRVYKKSEDGNKV